MPGSIMPLPVMLEEEQDRQAYEQLEPPKSIVCRYGYMRMIAELPYSGDAKPGCGSKLVVRSPRGMELAEMLTTTCANAGCGKSVTRKQMLQYIENSGGKDYPFATQGRVLRVATIEDINEQARLDARKPDMIRFTKAILRELDLPMRLIEIELLLGGERIIFHYTADQWVDFRALVKRLASEYQTRIEMHQVNARDEARLVADYEKCGQHCCCRQFLKVLKPVSMRSAKVQKATLDPTKISGRCGRLMCCLRYEDQTYSELKKRLPHKQTRVMTEDGPGTVINSQILTQLILVKLDDAIKPLAFPLENIEKLTKQQDDELQAKREEAAAEREARANRRREPRRPHPGAPLKDQEVESKEGAPAASVNQEPSSRSAGGKAVEPREETRGPSKRKRKRRRKRRGPKRDGNSPSGPDKPAD